jgi:hypothetical protein
VGDDLLDEGSPRWAGILPLSVVTERLQPDPALPDELPVPHHLAALEGD